MELKKKKKKQSTIKNWAEDLNRHFSKEDIQMVIKHLKRCSAAATAKLLQSCSTLFDPIDGSPPGSSIHGISQARVLEWVAIAFSKKDAQYH